MEKPNFEMDRHAAEADKLGGLVGEQWGKAYEGYFDNFEVAESVAQACSEIIEQIPEDKRVELLEIGSGTGTVGEIVSHYLLSQGIETHLMISDKISDHVEANRNPDTDGMVFDNKEMPIADSSMDLVVARSVTHYESTIDDELKVLEEVKRILAEDGIFLDQAPTLASNEEVKLIKDIHNLVNKPMNLQTESQVRNMLESVFDEVRLSNEIPPALSAETKGFLERYNISPEMAPDYISAIQRLIESVEEDKRPNVRTTANGFEWDIPYSIYICEKQKKRE